MSEISPTHEQEPQADTPSRLRRYGRRMLRRLGIHMPERHSERSFNTEADREALMSFPEGGVTAGSEVSDELLHLINNAPGSVRGDQFLPSFEHEVRKKVGLRVDYDQLAEYPEDSSDRKRLSSVQVRVDKFISAPGLEDWQDGRTGAKLKDGRAQQSRRIIDRYARMDPDTAGELSTVIAYIQSNGETYFKLIGDGAHRLAAARKRGDEHVTVTAAGFEIRYLDGNNISDTIAVQDSI